MLGNGQPVRLSDTPFAHTSAPLLILGLFIDGAMGVVFSVTTATVRQSATPDRLLAPVMALNYTLTGAAVAVGTLTGGLIGALLGPGNAILLGATFFGAAGLSAIGRNLGTMEMYREPYVDLLRRTFENRYTQTSGALIARSVLAPSARQATRSALGGETVRQGRCTFSDCGRIAAVQCAYIDRDGLQCSSRWCGQHAIAFDGAYVCPRHARLLTGLGKHLTDQSDLPPVDNWAASLTVWIGQELDGPLEAALQALYPPDRGFATMQEPVSSAPWRGGRLWRTEWVVSHGDEVAVRVMLAVTEFNDKLVTAIVNGREVARQVPPWIDRSSAADAGLQEENRQQFFADLRRHIMAAVPRP